MDATYEKITESVESAQKKISALKNDNSLVFPMFTDLHTADCGHKSREQ